MTEVVSVSAWPWATIMRWISVERPVIGMGVRVSRASSMTMSRSFIIVRRWPVGVDIQRLLNVIEKPSAVQDPGQWIPFRQVGQFLILKFQVTLGFAYFSEVGDEAKHPVFVVQVDPNSVHFHRDRPAVGCHQNGVDGGVLSRS